ncbi:MAG: YcjX family protein [Pseudomonadota bacterium]
MKDRAERSVERTVRLAVTGLSGSGKTVFTCSLLHQLQHLRHQAALLNLPGLAQIQGVRIQDTSTLSAPRFPYQEALERLGAPDPHWPESTRNVSEIRVAIRYRPKKRLGTLFTGTRTLNVDVVDYPGEWLLDLPLLKRDYAEWSRQAMALCRQEPRAELSTRWREFAGSLDAGKSALENTALITEGARLYRDYLGACSRLGLQFIQPGRFVLPGDLEGAPIIEFFPVEETPRNAGEGTIYRTLAQRFEAYKKEVVAPFYKHHFAEFDRQIILVDLLSMLNTGEAAFQDTRDALVEILENFRYGKANWLTRIFRPKIDRVLFAATKADRVSRDQSPLLTNFLSTMLMEPENNVGFQGVGIRHLAISALCCTRDVKCTVEQLPASCVQGVPVGGNEMKIVFPGQVPSRPPAPGDWDAYNFMDFEPPVIPYIHGQPLDQLKMYEVISYLLGDEF